MRRKMSTVPVLLALLCLLLPASAGAQSSAGTPNGGMARGVAHTIQMLREIRHQQVRLIPGPGAERGRPTSSAHRNAPSLMGGGTSDGSGTITGTVAVSSSGPMDRMWILAFPVDTTNQEAWFAEVSSDGAYAIRELPADDYYVMASGDGLVTQFYDNATQIDDATPVTVRDGQITSNIDFRLESYPAGDGVISGRVTDGAGNGIPGYVAAVDPNNPWMEIWAEVAADGSYQIQGLVDGSYFLQAQSIGYLTQWYDDAPSFDQATAVTIANEGTVTGIDFTLSRGGLISGRVVDKNGDPIEGAMVEAYPESMRNPTGDTLPPDNRYGMTTTDPDGYYTIGGLASGNYLVAASVVSCWFYSQEWYDGQPGIESANTVAVTIGSTTTGIDFQLAILEGNGKIEGYVTDTTGTPLENVSIMVENPLDSNGIRVWAMGITDATGHYSVEGLPDDEYVVSAVAQAEFQMVQLWWPNASDPTGAQLVPVSGGVSTPSSVDFVMALKVGTGSISGVVHYSDGTPAPYAMVDVMLASPDGTGYWYGTSAVTDSNGSYTISRLPEGTFIVHAAAFTADAYGEQWYDGAASFDDADPVVLTSGEARTGIDFTLDVRPIFGTVSGRVVDATTGSPIAHAYIELAFGGGDMYFGVPLYAVTDDNGQYTIARVPAGEYMPTAFADGAFAFLGNGTDPDNAETLVVVGDSTVAANFALTQRLSGSGSIAGNVTNVNGAPIDPAVILAIPSDASSDYFYTGVTTSTGSYRVPGVPDGTYYVLCWAPNGIGEFYRDAFDPAEAELVTVSNGAAVTGIDFGLETMRIVPIDNGGGSEVPAVRSGMYGQVTDNSGHPLAGANVYVLDENRNAIASTHTGTDGRYELNGIPPGAKYRAMASVVGYATEYNNGSENFENAKPVSVNGGRVEVNFTLAVRTSGVRDDNSGVTRTISSPNPFSSSTTISYTLDRPSSVRVTITDARGNVVRQLQEGTLAGRQEVRWDGRSADGTLLGSGMYFYRIQTSSGLRSGSVMIVR